MRLTLTVCSVKISYRLLTVLDSHTVVQSICFVQHDIKRQPSQSSTLQ